MPKKQLESIVDKCADENFCGGDCSKSEAENENELESKEKTVSRLRAFEQPRS